MGIPIEKSFVVNAPATAVWDFLTDPRRVARCLPGAAITEQVDDQTWAGTMTVKVGPVTAAYRGKLRFERLDPAAREAELSAAGQETRGKGGADMRMQSRIVERSPNESEVTVRSDVNVVGILAQFGRGMIQDVSDQMFQKFSDGMRRELATATAPPAAADAPAAPPPAAAPPAPAGPAPASTATVSAPAGPATPAASAPAPAAEATAPATGATAPAQAAPSTAAAGPAASTPAAVSPATPGSAATAQAPRAAAAPPPPPPPLPVHEEVLDVGAIGGRAMLRAAGRTVRRPGFWLAAAVVLVLIYWIAHR